MTQTTNKRRTFIDAWLTQHSVIKALTIRELQGRYGRDNIGFLWVVAEPLMLASVITTLHSMSGVAEHGADLRPYPFALAGYCIFIIFRNSFNRAEGALHGISALLYHSQITLSDIMISRSLAETIGVLLAFFILSVLGIMLGLMSLPARPLYLFGAIIAMALLTHGMTMVVASAALYSTVIGRLSHAYSYFMFPLSGAFFTVSFLPPWARSFMLLNPMVTIFETARYGLFTTASPAYIYPGYVAAFIVVFWCWGLVSLRNARHHIHIN